MIRRIGTALVILGLIAQPLGAAMPDSMPIGETSSSVAVDRSGIDIGMSDHGHMGSDQSSQVPCHETGVIETAPMPCTDCDSDCANGACDTACSFTTLAVLNLSFIKFEPLSVVGVVAASSALIQEHPSRIFHPPKHA